MQLRPLRGRVTAPPPPTDTTGYPRRGNLGQIRPPPILFIHVTLLFHHQRGELFLPSVMQTSVKKHIVVEIFYLFRACRRCKLQVSCHIFENVTRKDRTESMHNKEICLSFSIFKHLF